MSSGAGQNLRLAKIGITHWQNLYYNLSYDELFVHETDSVLSGLERGVVTEQGALNVNTGKYTGRSPKDKYVVEEDNSKDKIWWATDRVAGSDNQKLSPPAWKHLKEISLNQLNGKKLYVMDGFCGANPQTRLKVRIVTEAAWQAHFFKNMFIRPDPKETQDFDPDWTILHACKATCQDFKQYDLRSEVFVAFHMQERMTLIGGTWYAGEVKKGIFSVMNYFLPLKGIGSFHCSANMGEQGDTAIFFGLSGTGKTTLSTDPKRALIGDDEHGWDEEGVFNLEGGCYAKCINLSSKKEPQIYNAIHRDALLENVEVDERGRIDFTSSQKTENTRVSYPLYHIDNIVKPVSKGGHPQTIIFLVCDAFGIFPPVAKLTNEQAMYHYLSGYTAKLAGTEQDIHDPKATFSTCFGQAFLFLQPTVYAEILGRKMKAHKAAAYVVNTGWVGGKSGVGERVNLGLTRKIIDAIMDRTIEDASFETMPVFGFQIPKTLKDVDYDFLNPQNAWSKPQAYQEAARELAKKFISNFKKFNHVPDGRALLAAGPTL